MKKGGVSKLGSQRKALSSNLPGVLPAKMPDGSELTALGGCSLHPPAGALRGAAKKGAASAAEAADTPELAEMFLGGEHEVNELRRNLRQLQTSVQ